MNDEQKKAELAALTGAEPEPKKKAGGKRPPFKPAATFDEAMKVLRPAEAAFVRHCLAGKNQREAYALTHPNARDLEAHRGNGARMAMRAPIKHALALGKQAGALQAITGLAFDQRQAHDEICQRIEAATAAGQHSAVANLLKLKLTLWKLDQPAAQQAQGVQIVLYGADGVEVKSFGSLPQQPATDIESEEIT